jgi:hypothetical protein
MKTKTINARKAAAMTKFDLALQIRQLLDAARKEYIDGPEAWDDQEIESEISELVFGDDE